MIEITIRRHLTTGSCWKFAKRFKSNGIPKSPIKSEIIKGFEISTDDKIMNQTFSGIQNKKANPEILMNLLAPDNVKMNIEEISYDGSLQQINQRSRPLRVRANMKLELDSDINMTSIDTKKVLGNFEKQHYDNVSQSLGFLMDQFGAESTGTKEQVFTVGLMKLKPNEVDKLLTNKKTPLSQWKLTSILSYFVFMNELNLRRFTFIIMKSDLSSVIEFKEKLTKGEIKINNSNSVVDLIEIQIAFASKFKIMKDNERCYKIINDNLLSLWIPYNEELSNRLLTNLVRLIKSFYKSSLNSLQDLVVNTENLRFGYIFWEEIGGYKSTNKVIDFFREQQQQQQQQQESASQESGEESRKPMGSLSDEQKLILQIVQNPLFIKDEMIYKDLIQISKDLKLSTTSSNLLNHKSIVYYSKDIDRLRSNLLLSLSSLIQRIDLDSGNYSEFTQSELSAFKDELIQVLELYKMEKDEITIEGHAHDHGNHAHDIEVVV